MEQRPPIDSSPAWQALQAHAAEISQQSLRGLFATDAGRFDSLSWRQDGLLLDLSRQRLSKQTLRLLLDLAEAAQLTELRDAMFAGEHINLTEDRAVLHSVLRLPPGSHFDLDGEDVAATAQAELDRMGAMVAAIREGTWLGATGKRFRTAINIGIGGSDLGPRMAVDALAADHQPGLDVRFVSNVDGADLARAVAGLDPAETLFIVASKTFTTQETMTNAASARAWLQAGLGRDADWPAHFIALSAAPAEMETFGIKPDHRLTFWDWVGGRYSLWSAIGLPIALAIGMENFRSFLAGAHAMDKHFQTAPLERNLPVLMALAGIWNINFLGFTSLAVLPYDQGLARLPAYLQQADMESNGKRVDRWSRPVHYATGPVVFGEPGTNGQHAFYQLLHQGTQPIPADFIVPLHSRYPMGENGTRHHAMLLANAFAQTEALAMGRPQAEVMAELRQSGQPEYESRMLAPHRSFPGNRPTTTLLLPRINPFTLGQLIALYEHKIFAQGAVWGINSFDQWGVELGKRLAKPILEELTDPKRQPHHDPATNGLIEAARKGAVD